MKNSLTAKFWELQTKPWLLMFAAAFILLIMLPYNELWTVESRWAAVTLQMLLKHDYLHPYRYCQPYYDKPLLSYWLIIIFAKLFGNLSQFALRLPSAIAGLVTIWTTYSLGKKLFNQQTGLIAGWLLTTTFYFIFWSRVASADILNIAGSMLAILWYVTHKDNPTFRNYLVFFLITAITCLFKGLLGLVIPGLIILPDILTRSEWKKHLKPAPFLAFILAAAVYFIPFLASALIIDPNATGSGLLEVFRENILRFIEPFDHKGPIYTYFLFLPLYTLPWFLLFIPTILHSIRHWKHLPNIQRWLLKGILLLFVFLTLSGSRRSYYVLPLVPVVILSTAAWLNSICNLRVKCALWLTRGILSCYILLCLWFGVAQPIISHYKMATTMQLINKIHTITDTKSNWSEWQLLVFNNPDHKIVYYLQPEKIVNCYQPSNTPANNAIIIMEQKDFPAIQSSLKNYQQASSGPLPNDVLILIADNQQD